MDTHRTVTAFACGIASAAIGLALVAGVLFHKQIKSVASVKRHTGYDDGYDLYEVDIAYDYDLDQIIASEVRSDQAYLDAVANQVLPCIPIHMEAPRFACSAFGLTTAQGPELTGRNYDFKDDTSALLVRTRPKDGYASVGFTALNNLGSNKPLDSLEGRAAAIMGPFAQLDGVNEKGVSIAVLTLDSDPCDQDTGRPVINTSLAIRLVLDRAASTQEAVELLSVYDMHAMAGRDYHFFINDASGDARVVEYDPRDPERTLVATPVRQITNYYALYEHEVRPNQKNGDLGHGKERAIAIANTLDAAASPSESTAWAALHAAAQDPNPMDITSNTQWSVVFNNTDPGAKICLRRHWGDITSFEL